MILTLSVRMPKGPAHYWTAAQDFGEAGFTAYELWKCTNGVSRGTIQKWVAAMVERGALKEIGRRPGTPERIVYACARKNVPANEAAAYGDVQLYLWTAMRTLSQFTVSELAAVASTDTVEISRDTAQQYIRRLAKAGALTVVRPGKPNNRDSGVWRLRRSRDTGPRAPQWVKAAFLYDPNENEAIGEAEGSL